MTGRDLLAEASDEIRRLRERVGVVEAAVRRHRAAFPCEGCGDCRAGDRELWRVVLDEDWGA